MLRTLYDFLGGFIVSLSPLIKVGMNVGNLSEFFLSTIFPRRPVRHRKKMRITTNAISTKTPKEKVIDNSKRYSGIKISMKPM